MVLESQGISNPDALTRLDSVAWRRGEGGTDASSRPPVCTGRRLRGRKGPAAARRGGAHANVALAGHASQWLGWDPPTPDIWEGKRKP